MSKSSVDDGAVAALVGAAAGPSELAVGAAHDVAARAPTTASVDEVRIQRVGTVP